MNWRTVSLLLILANLFYWAWAAYIVQPDIVGLEDHRIESVPKLVLISADELEAQKANSNAFVTKSAEISPESVPTGVSASLSTGNEPSSLICQRIGSFIDDQVATAAAQWLRQEGIEAQKKTGEETILGYWVYLPKYPVRDAAVKVVEALREKGVDDLFIETAAPFANSVSLGLYLQRSGAQRRSRQIKALGYPTRIGNKETNQQVFWVDIQVESGREIPLNQLQAPVGQVQRLKIKACE